MKIILLLLITIFSNDAPLYADDLNDGINAYHRGKYKIAYRIIRPSSDNGNMIAQWFLGKMYAYGQGVKQDYQEAAKLYALSAKQGYPEAQHKLGLLYHQGHGVQLDYKKSGKFFKLSAEQGHPKAQYDFGIIFYQGLGVQQDFLKSIKWLLKAAKNGIPEAQILLKEVSNFKWIKLSAEKGDAYAQTFLGDSYYLGLNVVRDYGTSAKWYRKAANQGNVSAQNILGAMNEKGKGISKNYIEASKWFTISEKSVLNGANYGRIFREKIEQRMDTVQISKARKLAKKWIFEHKNKPEAQR